jgi:cytochrome c biogenesis protein CcdA
METNPKLRNGLNVLSTLDPAQTALVPAKLAGLSQDSAAQAQIPDYSGDRYRIHYHFGLGAAISLIGVALCGMLLTEPRKMR